MRPWPLTSEFPPDEQQEATELLLGAPLQWLENRGLIRQGPHQTYVITPKGQEAARQPGPSFFADEEMMSALPLLHRDFHSYAHFFYDNKLKEAVAAAFERYENKLNEVRDGRGSTSAQQKQGRALLSALFNEGILVRPYPKLGAAGAKAAEEVSPA
jgi:hypothetical protein